jgi:hypothetical protein
MTHIRRGSNSLIAQAIETATEELDSDLALNPCEVTSANCRLSSGIETTFVALTAHWLLEKVRADGHRVRFQEAIYMPSRRAERRGGFDLSIGEFTGRTRVRTMHKVLYGKSRFNGTKTFNRWCDESWNWAITQASGGDYMHLWSLLDNFAQEQVFRPYLVLHLCYCVHEYRRMGRIVEGLHIPAFDSLLRTVVVDLGAIFDGLGGNIWQPLAKEQNFQLQVAKRVPERCPGEEPRAHLDRISARELFQAHVVGSEIDTALPIMTLDELYASAGCIWARPAMT